MFNVLVSAFSILDGFRWKNSQAQSEDVSYRMQTYVVQLYVMRMFVIQPFVELSVNWLFQECDCKLSIPLLLSSPFPITLNTDFSCVNRIISNVKDLALTW